jgi:hypothetical protein
MRRSMSYLLVCALGLISYGAFVAVPSADGATRPKTLVTCVNSASGAQRILTSGTCNSLKEKKVSWKYLASGTKSGAIVICTNSKTGINRISSTSKCTTGKEIKSVWVKVTTSTASPAALTCAQGGKCARKDVGPGGGLVFYVADSPQPWGTYLEVAPTSWSGSADPRTTWCNVTDSSIVTKFEIGDGKANTATLVGQCSSSAAALAVAYRGGGKSDWYLPSYKEIKELHGFAFGLDIPGYAPEYYWSSSQDGVTTAWAENFGAGGTAVASKSSQNLVRPIRAF